MIAVLSPAKTLDETSPVPPLHTTEPQFADEAAALASVAAKLTPRAVAKLMHISPALATLNVARFRDFADANPRPALMTFDGDVYAGLQGKSLTAADRAFAQTHVRILSGLYGVLRPLDLMRPYRLEMGTALKTARRKDLYAFWGTRIADALAAELADHADNTLVNLASAEYFGAVAVDQLPGAVLAIDFRDESADGALRFNTFAGKRSRGAMARFIVDERLASPEGMKDFSGMGYRFRAAGSDDGRWLFVRPAASLKATR